jgi:uncharacterized protein
MEFDRHTLVLLRWPEGMRRFSADELERSQSGHLAYLARMYEAGHLAVSGPFDDQEDDSLRGVSLYRTSLEETRRLVQEDPAVQMGRLEPVLQVWLVPRDRRISVGPSDRS